MVASIPLPPSTNAATLGSAQSIRREAEPMTLPVPAIGENFEASGELQSPISQHDEDLMCVEAWVADTRYQNTGSATQDGRSRSTAHDVCARHRNMQEALLDTTSNGRVRELLQQSDTENLAERLAGGEGDDTASPVCTCEVIIEVDEEESRSISMEHGEGSAE